MSYLEDQRQKAPPSYRVTFFSHPVTITGGGVFSNRCGQDLTGFRNLSGLERLLKSPEKYKVMDPKDFISPAKKCKDTLTAITYPGKNGAN